jgi:RimJ/RimL family protein N-acetyltransferase
MADREPMYAWRNHPDTRRFFFDPTPLAAADHARWFAAALADPRRHLLVAEDARGPVGVLRFDVEDREEEAAIDIYVVPERRGSGLGTPLLRAGLDWLRQNTNVRRLNAEVVPANRASCRMFEACGFQFSGTAYVLELGRRPS